MSLQAFNSNRRESILNLFQGLRPLGQEQKAFEFTGRDLEALEIDQAFERAPSGALINFPMKFLAGNYKAYDKRGNIVDFALPEMRLPVVHLASFSRSKIVAITDMGSGRGSVKEVDGHSDWKIDIAGIITDEKGNPNGNESFRDMIESLSRFDLTISAVDVSSELLTMLGVYRVFITEISIEQIAGTHSEFDFSMSLLSDEEFELEIIP